jgi:hypothetical protein
MSLLKTSSPLLINFSMVYLKGLFSVLISHPACTGPIIKHIPRSARPHIATELTITTNNVIHNPDDPSNSASIGSTMLHASSRTGRRYNLASALKKRNVSSNQTAAEHFQDSTQRRQGKSNNEQSCNCSYV